jgi:hypothetical protein
MGCQKAMLAIETHRTFDTHLHTIVSMLILRDLRDDFRCRSWARRIRVNNSRAHCRSTHFRLMLSTPIATPRDASPTLMPCAMWRMAIRPDEHSLFTTLIGTWYGIPAAMAAALET